MGNISHNNSLPSTESVILAAQISASQNLDQDLQNSNRAQKHEHYHYVTKRAREFTRLEKEAKKEAIKKGEKVSTVRQTQAVRSDSMRAAGEEMGNSLRSPKVHKELQKPRIPTPTTPFGSGEGKEDDVNVMAIIARVLVLVTNVQIKGWSTFWKMGAQNINTSWTMSQAEAQNTQQQYQMQANATKTQADQAGKEGWTQLALFGTIAVVGATAGETQIEKEAAANENIQFSSDTPGPAANAEGAIVDQAEDRLAAAQVESAAGEHAEADADAAAARNTDAARDASRQAEQQEARNVAPGNDAPKSKIGAALDTVWELGRKYVGSKSQVQKLMHRVLTTGTQRAAGISPLFNAIQNISITQPLQAQKSAYEGEQGVYAAAATLARGYSEYNNQVFNRNEDIRQQTSQGVDYAMNVYKSASDALTQAVSTMAR